jgi:hypothetical protein
MMAEVLSQLDTLSAIILFVFLAQVIGVNRGIFMWKETVMYEDAPSDVDAEFERSVLLSPAEKAAHLEVSMK